jgi:glycosyltransferase involved in cell wall biosynthesis
MPRITVITPSYQQGRFLERAIRSVLAQGYPNLDFRVYDGGSTDESCAILGHYGAHLEHWESRPDRGQSHAINKGLREAQGEIVGWLNSDDILLPGALWAIAHSLGRRDPPGVVVGSAVAVLLDGRRVVIHGRYEDQERLLAWWRPYEMPQPAIYWRRDLLSQTGLLDEAEHQAMDYDLWVRLSKIARFEVIPNVLAEMTAHAEAKTADGFAAYRKAQARVSRAHWGSILRRRYWRLAGSRVSHLTVRPLARALRAGARQELRRRRI